MKIFTHDRFGKVLVCFQDGKLWFCGIDVAQGLGLYQPNDAIITQVNEKDRIDIRQFLRHMKNSTMALRLRKLHGWMLTYEGVRSLTYHPQLWSKIGEEYLSWIDSCVVPNADTKEILNDFEIAKQNWANPNLNQNKLFFNTAKHLHKMQKLLSIAENRLLEYMDMRTQCYEVIGKIIRQYSWDNEITLTKVWKAYIDLLDLKMNKEWYHGDKLKHTKHISDIKIYKCIDIQGLPMAIALAVELTKTDLKQKG